MMVTFWGVRGSIPAPLAPDDIKTKIVQALRRAAGRDLSEEGAVRRFVDELPAHIAGTFGGNTPCVQLDSGGTTLVFDAGSGIRKLGMYLMKSDCGQGRGTVHLFLSHTHWDHIQGFPFFLPAYTKGNHIVIYSPFPDIEKRLSRQQSSTYFPVSLEAMAADIDFVIVPEQKAVVVGDTRITSIALNHPGRSFAYRVAEKDAAFVYATDGEFTNLSESDTEKYLGFFSNANALVFDSQYTLLEALRKEDWGHSPSLKGVDIARQAGVKTLILFHHEPAYDDQALGDIQKATLNYANFQGIGNSIRIVMAYEGLQLAL